MKLPPLRYHRPATVDELVALLSTLDGARVLAGGQSLLPLLADRATTASHLLDLAGIRDLDGVEPRDDGLVLGATVRQATLVDHPLVRAHAPLLADAAALVGNAAIRSRGTLGGSLAQADPAAELVVAALACDAEVELAGPDGTRRVGVAGVVSDERTRPGPREVIVAVHVPSRPGWLWAIAEVTRRTGDRPVVCVAGGAGPGRGARLACGGASPRARRLPAGEAALSAGGPATAVADAADGDLAPVRDLHGTAPYRRHVARHLVAEVAGRLTGAAR